MLYTDLREVKSLLEIDQGDKSEDKKLLFLIEQASQLVEEYLNRPGLSYQQRLEYYQATNTQKICLRSRPVFPQSIQTPMSVIINEFGYYGSASGSFPPGSDQTLVYGQDYCLKIDQDDGTSRSGILIRINYIWQRPQIRQQGLLSPFIGEDFGSIQVTYFAGYTIDTLPAAFRMCMNALVGRMNYLFPLTMAVSSESYEERSIGLLEENKNYLLGIIKPFLCWYRNYKW